MLTKLLSPGKNSQYKYRRLVGVGGIGSGLFFVLEGNHDLGRNESRPARLVDARDYCKLHIITHYLAILLDVSERWSRFHLVPVGKVGADDAGVRLKEELNEIGVDTQYVQNVNGEPTLFSVCYQYPDGTGGNITTSTSAASLLTTEDIDSVTPLLEESKNQSVVLVVPEVPLHVRQHLLHLGAKFDALRVGSFTSAEILEAQQSGMFSLLHLVFLNQDEASTLVGRTFDPSRPDLFLEICAATLTAIQPGINIVITAGKEGAFGFSRGVWTHSRALPVNVTSSAGAGDALLAATLAALIVGLPLTKRSDTGWEFESALDFGVLFGTYSTTSSHTIHPRPGLNEVLRFAEDARAKFSQASTKSIVGDSV